MAEPRYGYNAAGQWTILQPGEEELKQDPASLLSFLYGNDTTSLMGSYYNAGGNILGQGGGGLLSTAGAVPKNTSISDIVYDYTRPYTEEEQTKILNAGQAWRSMFMNSPLWNPGGANDYAIQNEPINTSKNTVADQDKWSAWASSKGYIKPTTTGSSTSNGTNVINNSSSPIRLGGGLVNNSVLPTNNSNYKPENILQPSEQRQNPLFNTSSMTSTNNNTTQTPYLSRVSNNMAYSGAPRYNDVIQTNNQANTGLAEATKAPSLGTPTRGRNTDFSKALWR